MISHFEQIVQNMSGKPMLSISASKEALYSFNELVKHTWNCGTACLTFRIQKKSIIPETNITPETTSLISVHQFCKNLIDCGEPRYGVVNMNNKLIFVYWSPETSTIQNKMSYAAVELSFGMTTNESAGKPNIVVSQLRKNMNDADFNECELNHLIGAFGVL